MYKVPACILAAIGVNAYYLYLMGRALYIYLFTL